MKTLFTAVIESVGTRADKSLKIVLGSNEQTPTAIQNLFEMHQKSCIVLISSNPISEAEADAIDQTSIDAYGVNAKTCSQRLRAVLFKLFEQSGEKDFKAYYEAQMNMLINHFKNKIQ